MSLVGARSKFYFYNTLVCMLKALEGKRITVEIRNNITVVGRLDFAESTMNLNLSDVVWIDVLGKQTAFPKFYVKGRQIVYVHIPDEVDVVNAMKWQLNKGEYFQRQERQQQNRIFERKQRMREKSRQRLDKREERSQRKYDGGERS